MKYKLKPGVELKPGVTLKDDPWQEPNITVPKKYPAYKKALVLDQQKQTMAKKMA